jgi:hypothetical protein
MKTQPAEEENLFSEPAVVSEEKGERQWQKRKIQFQLVDRWIYTG